MSFWLANFCPLKAARRLLWFVLVFVTFSLFKLKFLLVQGILTNTAKFLTTYNAGGDFEVDLERVQTDALVIGGGLAGLSAALELRAKGWNVTIVSKGKVGQSGNTIMTRNSMAAVLAEAPKSGTAREHVEDTLAGGVYLNDQKLVWKLAAKAEDGIKSLERWGVPFLRQDGRISSKGSPGHGRERILTVDARHLRSTHNAGLALSLPLLEKAKEAGVTLLNGILITGLLKKDGTVGGAYGLDRGKPQVWFFESRVVILASGGVGQLYPLTTNAGDVSGDGYALGYLAGAKVRDMEFIQFHPTVSMGASKEVLSTAPFSDGAVLRNKLGDAFMTRYSPEGDMATRDVMARAVYEEIRSGRGSEHGGVYVDFSEVPPAKMAREYEPIQRRLNGSTTIEVGTAAHFMMGGIVIDEFGRTGASGLYACGEVTGGVHGANRLAGNALTEAVVFGIEVGRHAGRDLDDALKTSAQSSLKLADIEQLLADDGIHLQHDLPWEKDNQAHDLPGADGNEAQEIRNSAQAGYSLEEIKKKLRLLMGLNVGIVRSGSGLSQAMEELSKFQVYLEQYRCHSYTELLAHHQLKLMILTAVLITQAARQRRDSLGAHYRKAD